MITISQSSIDACQALQDRRDEERLNAEIAQERAEREDFVGEIDAFLNLNKFGALNTGVAFPIAVGMLEKALRYIRED